jgi:hypothetical protein
VHQRRAFWGQLAEDHVEIRDCRERDGACDGHPEWELDGEWEGAERIAQDAGEGSFRDPAQSEAGQRDTELAGRQQ